jgi:murein L,D-transpeptidase YafK
MKTKVLFYCIAATGLITLTSFKLLNAPQKAAPINAHVVTAENAGAIMLRSVKKSATRKWHPRIHKKNEGLFIIIDKSDYELNIYDEEGWLMAMPAVFGSKDQGDKMKEGDRKTPNGDFSIIEKRPHKKWKKLLLLDYPTQYDYQKFNDRKAKGLIPKSSKIGNGIAIHGCNPGEDFAVDYYKNWTNGCISLKSDDILELFEMLPVGTRVTIQP